jgi:hypothetical protein
MKIVPMFKSLFCVIQSKLNNFADFCDKSLIIIFSNQCFFFVIKKHLST